jgi:hypothetical protein
MELTMIVAEFDELEKIMQASADEHGLCRSCLVIAVAPGDIY